MQYGKVAYEIGSRSAPGVLPKDVAHSLARLNRYNGHTNDTLSVARHCVYVSKLVVASPLAQLYALVHDVPETVTGDMTYPMKKSMPEAAREWFEGISDAAEEAIFKVLRVPYPMPENIRSAVKHADWVAAATEKRDLMPECNRDWSMLPHAPSLMKARATPWASADYVLWLEAYMALALHFKLWA